MQLKYDILSEKEQASAAVAQETAQLLEQFLLPLMIVLDRLLDKRLVRTLVQCCVAIMRFRNSKQGLLLSELGSFMDGLPGAGPTATAGTKRLGNLIRSLKWSVVQIDQFLLSEAEKEVKRLRAEGKRILCIWDGSVLEKPESSKIEGLCPVVSSKAKRLNRNKKGLVFNFAPKKAIVVAGMQWTGVLLTGMEGMVKVAMMSWWTTRGDYATNQRTEEGALLRKCVRQWGDQFLHVFDRGYGTGPWLQVLQTWRVKFVIRWKKGLFFRDQNGKEKKLWQIGQGKKYYDHKEVRDPRSGVKMPCAIWWAPVWHEASAYQLYLVKVRVNKKVWYLVTNEPVRTGNQAWEIFFAYRRRWQIEWSFRYGKCELGMESPRLWCWENRLKLLKIVTLVYAFLLHLLHILEKERLNHILRLKCHRTGKRCRNAFAPLYRLRWAISRLWSDSRPIVGSFFSSSWEVYRATLAFRP
jgi:Transposase DDE domain